MKPPQEAQSAEPALTALYDGACPLCRREIGLYQGLCARQAVDYADVSQASTPLPPGATQAQLMARFHVQTADGRLLQGAAAFLALWALLPGWRWLARLGALPGVVRLMEWAYVGFLRWRPTLQRWARRWD
ncbi:thiol-disulfide oxidoreductase DCC family protein [Roseateles sp.]|uniref:thiol-disulfide oxidoreductase DCC family protein n=1 Tax=Roseateles sp. TaxID=1971397 RepID=UPI003BA69A2D